MYSWFRFHQFRLLLRMDQTIVGSIKTERQFFSFLETLKFPVRTEKLRWNALWCPAGRLTIKLVENHSVYFLNNHFFGGAWIINQFLDMELSCVHVVTNRCSNYFMDFVCKYITWDVASISVATMSSSLSDLLNFPHRSHKDQKIGHTSMYLSMINHH